MQSRSDQECTPFQSKGALRSIDDDSRNDVVNHLAAIDQMSDHVKTMIPMQVLSEIDNGKNPMQITRDQIERAAAENQFMNGKIAALTVKKPSSLNSMDFHIFSAQSYQKLLVESLCQNFPDLQEHLKEAEVKTEEGQGSSAPLTL